MPILALIRCDTQTSPLGVASQLSTDLHGQTVLSRTLSRIAQAKCVDQVVIVHPQAQADDIQAILSDCDIAYECFDFDPEQLDPYRHSWLQSRRWTPNAWRGGIGNATAYDELLPAGPLLAAMKHYEADSALLLGGDWCFIDPTFADGVMELHLPAPEKKQVCFTQAPPGLAPIALHRSVLEQLDEHHSTLGQVLGYNPKYAVADPIGREVCFAIDNQIRDCPKRFIYDTPRSQALMNIILEQMATSPVIDSETWQTLDTLTLAQTATTLTASQPTGNPGTTTDAQQLPHQVTLELTTQRRVNGPLVPQHWIELDRQNNQHQLDKQLAFNIIDQLATQPDICLRFGGLGDPTLHPDFAEIVNYASNSKIQSLGLDTDLLLTAQEVDNLSKLHFDFITVNLNADTANTYRELMGEFNLVPEADGFKCVVANIQYLMQERQNKPCPRLPWIMPSMVKVRSNVHELESFFDRWKVITGHAIIKRFMTGGGLLDDQSPVPMTPPAGPQRRRTLPLLTIHCDGQVTLGDQDWQAANPLGNAAETKLLDLWSNAKNLDFDPVNFETVQEPRVELVELVELA